MVKNSSTSPNQAYEGRNPPEVRVAAGDDPHHHCVDSAKDVRKPKMAALTAARGPFEAEHRLPGSRFWQPKPAVISNIVLCNMT